MKGDTGHNNLGHDWNKNYVRNASSKEICITEPHT